MDENQPQQQPLVIEPIIEPVGAEQLAQLSDDPADYFLTRTRVSFWDDSSDS